MKKFTKFLSLCLLTVFVLSSTACHQHTYASDWSNDDDYHWHASDCGHEAITDKAVHSWDEGTQTKDPSEEEEGLLTYTCEVCYYQKSVAIPKLDHTHTYSNNWSRDDEYHWHASNCGHEVVADKELHTYSWNTTEPTETSVGLAKGSCSACPQIKNINLPILSEQNGYSRVETEDGYAWEITLSGYKFTFSTSNTTVSSQYNWRPQITEVMPAIHIDTLDGSTAWATQYNRQDKLNDNIDYVDATVSTEACTDDEKLTGIAAEVKVRGNYTLEYEKKPIRIKFGKKQNLLGLHNGEKYKNWVLLADWKDLSMSNNSMAFYLGQTILGSDGYYCTDYRNVELYLNGQYWGVYLLVEQQEVKDDRTSFSEVEDDYTGTDIGYFFEYDGYYTDEINMPNGAGDPTFVINYQGGPGDVVGYTIKSDIYSNDQITFIQSYMNNVYKIAYQATRYKKYYAFNSTYTGLVDASNIYSSSKEAIAACIDLQSLVDTYILNEIACDADLSWSSFYMGVDMSATGNKLVTFEAPWDFDSSFGIKNNCCTSGVGMYAAEKNNPWIKLVVGEAWFQDMVKAKWAELVENDVFETALDLISIQKTTYESYYAKNYERWSSRILYGNGECVPILNTYKTQGQAADYLTTWFTTRINYLNSVWGNAQVEEEQDDWSNEGTTAYRYEAEEATTTDGISVKTGNGASANGYLGNVAGGAGKTITFTVNSSTATEAYLYVGLSRRSYLATFSTWFSVTVNSTLLTVPTRNIDACTSNEWHDWTSIKVVKVSLKAGSNDITLTTLSDDATNVDYIELFCATELA